MPERKVKLSPRQMDVTALVARGIPDKQIAARLGLSVRTVQMHIEIAASKIHGPESPRNRLMLFFLQLEDDSAA